MGRPLIIVGFIWALLGVGNIGLSDAWKSSGGTMQTAVLVFNFVVFILPGLIVAGVGTVFEIKLLLNQLLAEIEELNNKQSWTNKHLAAMAKHQNGQPQVAQHEPEEKSPHIDYFSVYCSKCVHYQESTGVCQKFYFNVREYPKKFIEKCSGDLFEKDDKIHFSCEKCGARFVAAKEQSGKSGECKNCGAPILVPLKTSETPNV